VAEQTGLSFRVTQMMRRKSESRLLSTSRANTGGFDVSSVCSYRAAQMAKDDYPPAVANLSVARSILLAVCAHAIQPALIPVPSTVEHLTPNPLAESFASSACHSKRTQR
jgi:hypothetical protein